MLVLTRKRGERIYIDNHIILEVTEIDGNRVRLGFVAPDDVPIYREEVVIREREKKEGVE
jgi:carbon storage regulator